jgi:serine/threonine protein kinase
LEGELRHINKLRFWPLEDVLHDKYEITREVAQTIASFLSPMLRLNPEKRAGAGELVHHRWLDGTVVQGEIDVIRRAEEEEARRRQPDLRRWGLARRIWALPQTSMRSNRSMMIRIRLMMSGRPVPVGRVVAVVRVERVV